MTKTLVLNFLATHKHELAEKFGVTKIGLFGSYAKDVANEYSDIDIVVEMEKKDFFIRDTIREYIEQHLKKPVDIGYFDSFRPFYRQKIEQEIIYV